SAPATPHPPPCTPLFRSEAAILKSLLGAIPGLAPKIVVTLGTARSKTATVQGIDLPTIGDPDDLDPGSVNDGEDPGPGSTDPGRSEEHTSELQSRETLVC